MPITNTYELITSQTLPSAQTGINLTSISQAYTHLVLLGKIVSVSAGNDIRIQVNGDTGANYNASRITASNTARTNGTVLNQTQGSSMWVTGTITTPMYYEMHFLYYSDTNNKKGVIGKASGPNTTSGEADILGYQYNSTNAISSIYIHSNASNGFAAGSYLQLYGITKA